MQKAINFNDIAIVSVKGYNYRIHIWYISKGNAIEIIKHFDLNEKSGLLKFFSYVKKMINESTYYQKKNRKR